MASRCRMTDFHSIYMDTHIARKSNRYLDEVLADILKHAVLVSHWLNNGGIGSFDHVLKKLASSKLPHVIYHADLEAIAIEVVILRVVYFDHQDQGIVDDVVLAEVFERGLQMFQHVFFAEDGLAEAVDQKVYVQGDDWRFRESFGY